MRMAEEGNNNCRMGRPKPWDCISSHDVKITIEVKRIEDCLVTLQCSVIL